MRGYFRNCFIIGFFIFILIFKFTLANGLDISSNSIVPSNKVWTIRFSDPLDIDSLGKQNIKVIEKDTNMEFPITISVSTDLKTIQVQPFINNEYKNHGTYLLVIDKGIKSKNGKYNKFQVSKEFTVNNDIIISIANIYDSVYQNETYALPKTVKATMNDNSEKQCNIRWNVSSIDTSKLGTYTYEGVVDNFPSKVSLNITVKEKAIDEIGIGRTFNIIGDWIYYTQNNPQQGLFKVKRDGTDNTKLINGSVYDFAILKDCIYYANSEGIYKTEISSNIKTKIGSMECRILFVTNGWIYYIDNDKYNIFRIRIDGTDSIKLSSDSIMYAITDESWIYYSNWSDNNYIYKMKNDGSLKVKIGNDKAAYLTIYDNQIYYINPYICKINIDGSDRKVVDEQNISSIKIEDDWIYYYDYLTQHFYRMRIDGSNKVQLTENKTYSAFILDISADWVYYFNNDDYKVYKMKKDGTENQEINSIKMY